MNHWHNTDLLLLGGSAGSFHFLFTAIRNFPADLGKAVVMVIHRKKNFFSEIEKLFGENSRMSMREIVDKDIIVANTVFIAPPNYHTLIEEGKYFSLDVSEAVWYSKPSIDVTFESAAEVYGSRCTAILLSGANQDGAEGLLKLRNAGALTIVQHPDSAEMEEMPKAAIQLNAAEYILHDEDIFELLRIKNHSE